MQYPNAYSGVKKIYTSQILTLVALFFMLVGEIGFLGEAYQNTEEVSATIFIFMGFVLISGIITLVAFIINIVGLRNAMKDEILFKKAIIWTIASIIIAVVSSIMGEESMVADIIDVFQELAILLTALYVVQAIINLASKIGSKEMAEQGKSAFWIILIVSIVSSAFDAVADFFPDWNPIGITGSVIGIIAVVLEIFVTFVYLKLISGAVKMLA